MTIAYLQFGSAATVSPGAFQTVEVECRETDEPRKGRTQTGYGAQMPTRYMVKWNGRWRRVYVANYGNAGTAYIGKRGAWLATVTL